MSTLEEFQRHYAHIKAGGTAENTLGYYMQHFTSFIWVWFPTDAWRKMSWPQKALSLATSLVPSVTWLLVLVDGLVMDFTLENAPEISRKVSIGIGAWLTMVKYVNYVARRDKMTALLRDVNDLMREFRAMATEERQEQHRRRYQIGLRVFMVLNSLMFAEAVIVGVYSLAFGQQYMELWLPVERTAYSWVWCLELGAVLMAIFYNAMAYTTQDVIFLDSAMQLAFCYQVTFDRLAQVGRVNDKETSSIIGWTSRNYCTFQGLTERLREIMWLPYTALFTIMYIILGTSLIAISLEMDNGIIAFLSNVPFPLYCLALTGLAAAFGQYFQDEANQLNETIYNAQWYEVSVPNRRMLITLMIVGQQEIALDLPPFVVVNREALGDLLRRTYTLYTVARSVFV